MTDTPPKNRPANVDFIEPQMFENLSLVTRKSLPRHSKMRCERVEPSRTKSINARGLKLGRSDGSTAKHVRYSSHFCGKRILGCTTHQKMVRKEVDSEQPSRTKSIKSRGLTLGAGRDQTAVLPNVCGIRHISAARGFWGCTTHQKMVRKEGVSEQGTRQEFNEAKI